jgi:uncharacterized protein (UPF0261 family)
MPAKRLVYLLATLDTKAVEAEFVRRQLQAAGVAVCLIDTGCLGTSTVQADVTNEQLFAAADLSLADLRTRRDRGQAVAQAALGAQRIVQRAYGEGQLAGVLALGGSAGTAIGTAAMRALPLGIPKLMVSTLASGQVRPYVADKDILMMNSVVDFAGLNRISRRVLQLAAGAMIGMIRHDSWTEISQPESSSATSHEPNRNEWTEATSLASNADRPLIAATMFGVTTPCVQQAKSILETAGYEVLVFHATGNGGQAMESLIDEGLIAGVLDITTTELADELVGGILSAGPDRLTAAARRGVPQVVSVGALDMVNFGPPATVPEVFRERLFYQHNPQVTLMRTTADECRQLGTEIARKVSATTGPAVILLPRLGLSEIDREGQVFNDPVARQSLFDAIEKQSTGCRVETVDYHINDPEFATAAARHLLKLLGK